MPTFVPLVLNWSGTFQNKIWNRIISKNVYNLHSSKIVLVATIGCTIFCISAVHHNCNFTAYKDQHSLILNLNVVLLIVRVKKESCTNTPTPWLLLKYIICNWRAIEMLLCGLLKNIEIDLKLPLTWHRSCLYCQYFETVWQDQCYFSERKKEKEFPECVEWSKFVQSGG